MRVAIVCRDKPGALQTRLDTRAAHLAYIKETGVVEQAGGLLDTEGRMCGSIVIVDVPDLAAAEAWAAGDPYGKAGLFESVAINAWNRVVG